MKRNLLIIIIGAVLVVIFALLLFTFQVRQSEVAVVTTFGKPTGAIAKPGLHLKWPWPIQKVYKFDERIQNFQDKFSENLTADNINLLISVYVGWRISDAPAISQQFQGRLRNRRPEPARKHVAQRQKCRRGQASAVGFCERGPEATAVHPD